MAKYLAGGRVRGTLHGVTYQRNMYTGWVAKEKSTLTKEQIETSPAFARTRENNNEMKGVGTYVKELRRSLDLFLPFVSDPIVTGRLIRELKKVQIATPGQRGFRPLVGTTIANLLVTDGFEVSAPYPLSQAVKGMSIEIGARTTEGQVTNQTMTITADSLSFPAGTNACLPIVTIIECDELEYADGVWAFMNPVEGRNIKRSVLYDKMVFPTLPTSAQSFEVAIGNTSTSFQSDIVAQALGVLSIFETKFPLPPYEFGRNLVWFGLQFGQLVQKAGGSPDTPVFEFMPMRGATAGKAIVTLDPINP